MKEKEEKDCKTITKEILYNISAEMREKVEGITIDGIYVKAMSGVERRHFHQMMADDKTLDSNAAPASMIPALIAICAVSENGDQIFGLEKADIEEIDTRIPALIQEKIFAVAARLNGLTEKSVDERVKN